MWICIIDYPTALKHRYLPKWRACSTFTETPSTPIMHLSLLERVVLEYRGTYRYLLVNIDHLPTPLDSDFFSDIGFVGICYGTASRGFSSF